MKDPIWGFFFSKPKSEEQQIRALLSKTTLFSGLSTYQLKLITRILHKRTYKPGEVVFKEGDPGIGLYIVWKGNVSVLLNEDDEVARFSYGDFFGDVALFSTAHRLATVKTVDSAVLLGLCKPDLAKLIDREPELGAIVLMRILELAGKRLEIANARYRRAKSDLEDLRKKTNEPAPEKSKTKEDSSLAV